MLGIESLDTGMTSLEKALLSPTQVFRHVRAVGRKYSTCDAVLIFVGVADVDGDSGAGRRSWQAGGKQLHGPDLVAAKGAWDKRGHQGVRQTSSDVVLTEIVS